MLRHRPIAKTQKEKESWSFKLKSVIAMTITAVFVIILGISFGQVPGCDGRQGGAAALATVDGEDITPAHPRFRSYYRLVQERFKDAPAAQQTYYALQGTVRELLLLKAAARNRLEVSPELLLVLLKDNLKREGMTEPEYMTQSRPYRQQFENSLRDRYLQLAVETDIRSAGRITDLHINLGEAMKSMTAVADVCLVSSEDWLAKSPVTDGNLRAFFDKGRESFGTWLKASHILVKDESKARELSEALARDKGQFAALAAKNSIDTASAAKGGSLGWFFPSSMVEAFSKTALALSPGQISAPVKSLFGWHIILLEEKKAVAAWTDLSAEGRTALADAYRRQNSAALLADAEKDLESRMGRVRDLVAKKTPFAAACREAGLAAVRTARFAFLDTPEADGKKLEALEGNAAFHVNAFSVRPGEVAPLFRAKGAFVLVSPVEVREDKSDLAKKADPELLKKLPQAEQDKVRKELTETMRRYQQQVQEGLFYDWFSLFQNRLKVTVNEKEIRRSTSEE